MKLRILRFTDTGEATAGMLLLCGNYFCFTLEDTQLETGEGIYCIPPGNYIARRVISAKFGETFTVEGVPGHSLLRVHAGNTSADTQGCVLLGLSIDLSNGAKAALFKSRAAIEMFLDAMRGVQECAISFEQMY